MHLNGVQEAIENVLQNWPRLKHKNVHQLRDYYWHHRNSNRLALVLDKVRDGNAKTYLTQNPGCSIVGLVSFTDTSA